MLHARIAYVLDEIKWPFAICCGLLLPATCMQLFLQLKPLFHSLSYRSPFFHGFYCFFILLAVFSHFIFNLFMTFEHEFNHGVFAALTGNKVTALKVFENGGKLEYQGTANWLISLAPYFFPTVALSVGIFTEFWDPKWRWLAEFCLGASIAYQLFSTLVETELSQPDLIESGIPFSIMTLPFLNVFSYSILTAYLTGGFHGIMKTLQALFASPLNPSLTALKWLIKHLF